MVLPSVRKSIIVDDNAAEDISRVEELSYELKIAEVMTRDVHFLSPEMTMRDVIELFRKSISLVHRLCRMKSWSGSSAWKT